MAAPGNIRIKDYYYDLPASRIAQFPLENRDESKLLIWKEGRISASEFTKIGDEIPGGSILVINDTRVIRARLIFTKNTGATIEIFCLEPISPSPDIQAAFGQTVSCTWKCLVGNVKRWNNGIIQKSFAGNGNTYVLSAEKKENLGDGCFSIAFTWQPSGVSFSEIIEHAGLVPLPPYITRESSSIDSKRYQTIFAEHEGSVAAPTAGLHFSEKTLQILEKKNITTEKVTLHVGIGTFRPVSVENIAGHMMHAEKISVALSTVRDLIRNHQRPVVAVGTTSVRTLESLYWLGVKLILGAGSGPRLLQWDAYDPLYDRDIPPLQALSALEQYIVNTGGDSFQSSTELMIVPGYRFRIVDGMITNFHMPQSTLLLLVAAFIGPEWKNVYEYALQNEFRFLSYGDACLFFKKEK